MKIPSIQPYQTSDIHNNVSLRKAAAEVAPPKLSDDEEKMIRREFPNSKPMTWYSGNGKAHQEQVSSRGHHIDIVV